MLSHMQKRLRIESCGTDCINQDNELYPLYGTYEDICYHELFVDCESDVQCVLNIFSNLGKE